MSSKVTKGRDTRPKRGTSKDGGRSAKKGVSIKPAEKVSPPAASAAEKRESSSTRRKLKVEVVWGDITKAEGDIHFVGHYMGVLPQKAEYALDSALSWYEEGSERKRIIREWTKRGLLRGELGEISFFPWDRKPSGDGKRSRKDKKMGVIGVAGMGRPGTFHRPQLKILARSIARAVGLLPVRKTITTVLIGAGTGNIRIKDAAQTLVEGIAEALRDDKSLTVEKVQIVERYLDRAIEIRDALIKSFHNNKLNLEIASELPGGDEGEVSPEFSCSMLLASLADETAAPTKSDGGSILDDLLQKLPPGDPILRKAREKLLDVAKRCAHREGEERLRSIAMQLRLREEDEGPNTKEASRAAFWAVGKNIHAAAITNTVTVTERQIAGRLGLVELAIERLMDPAGENWEQIKKSAGTLLLMLVHPDVKEILWQKESLIVEVDAKMARVQWEMLPSEDDDKPLGVVRSITRQLRTSYSPRLDKTSTSPQLKVLIIGDPGDPMEVPPLPAAREEAYEVFKLFKNYEIDTTLLIGPPEDGTNAGTFYNDEINIGEIPPADYFEVVRLLLTEHYDIVHFCGHAQFDPEAPENAGWVFKGGVLTARDLEGMERPPSLIVANACLTAQLSQSHAPVASDKPAASVRKNYPGLVATLAEEFFRRGISDYIGTAWEVISNPAKKFATVFYDNLLSKKPLGEAVRLARVELYNSPEVGPVWAAYQHYGDPMREFKFTRKSATSRGAAHGTKRK